MEITLGPDLERAITEAAIRQGIAPEEVALKVLRERLLPPDSPLVPQDEWERRLLAIGKDCGVSLPDSALTRDELYESSPPAAPPRRNLKEFLSAIAKDCGVSLPDSALSREEMYD